MPSAAVKKKKAARRADRGNITEDVDHGTADGEGTAEASSRELPIQNAPIGRHGPFYSQKWEDDVNKAEVFL